MTTIQHNRIKNTLQLLRRAAKELPDFAQSFSGGIDSRTTALTHYAYATDFNLFSHTNQ